MLILCGFHRPPKNNFWVKIARLFLFLVTQPALSRHSTSSGWWRLKCKGNPYSITGTDPVVLVRAKCLSTLCMIWFVVVDWVAFIATKVYCDLSMIFCCCVVQFRWQNWEFLTLLSTRSSWYGVMPSSTQSEQIHRFINESDTMEHRVTQG